MIQHHSNESIKRNKKTKKRWSVVNILAGDDTFGAIIRRGTLFVVTTHFIREIHINRQAFLHACALATVV
jgi:hypothetical protein